MPRALDLRLPTGDKDNLLGTGATQAQFMFVASGELGVLSPHMNFGYTFSSGETSAAAVSADNPLTHSNNGTPISNVTLNQPDLSLCPTRSTTRSASPSPPLRR